MTTQVKKTSKIKFKTSILLYTFSDLLYWYYIFKQDENHNFIDTKVKQILHYQDQRERIVLVRHIKYIFRDRVAIYYGKGLIKLVLGNLKWFYIPVCVRAGFT